MSRKHLTISEREVISKLLIKGLSQAQLAKHLGRSKSTISRKIKSRARGFRDFAN